MSVIQRAKKLIEEVGAEEAIRIFETQIAELEDSNSFEDMCRVAGLETAIEFIQTKQKNKDNQE